MSPVTALRRSFVHAPAPAADASPADLALVDLITQTAALVIDRERAHTALREIAEMADEED